MLFENFLNYISIVLLSAILLLTLIIVSRILIRPSLFTNIKEHFLFFGLTITTIIWAMFLFTNSSINSISFTEWHFQLFFWLLVFFTLWLGIFLINYDYLQITSELNEQLISVTEEYVTAVENIEDVVISLARTIDAKDKYTEGHTERVSQYATFLAERIGLEDKIIEQIRIGALIHDIGKIGINLNVLNKNGVLTKDERTQIEAHPELGHQICSPLKAMEEIGHIIRHHHEKLDGSGYPDKLKGDEISIEIRIVTIADIFDALTTDRPYRKALDANHAINIIKTEANEGKLDIDLVNEFAEMLIELVVLD